MRALDRNVFPFPCFRHGRRIQREQGLILTDGLADRGAVRAAHEERRDVGAGQERHLHQFVAFVVDDDHRLGTRRVRVLHLHEEETLAAVDDRDAIQKHVLRERLTRKRVTNLG